ncbi:MAG: hypothetical protein QNJ12_13045 [Ilumatobacter sp.]|uniref:hypothetical protein n=1 Tax=Ilumatobacter sp. TaxID=1967498 RepID=UPI002606B559|nr:hypothetical protein [Ilumatobacter sp.]MDJ0769721.1 hypothetical protein [Ilumatobacter sp.]
MTYALTTRLTATAASVGDPEGTRAITSIIALLVALGLTLIMVAVWLYRSTRPDPELLAPLEAMGERRWRRRDPVWQRRRLDELRPAGAEPIEPIAAPPEVDEAFEKGPTAGGFDDLHDGEGERVGVAADERTGTSRVEPAEPAEDAAVDEEARRAAAADTPVETERPLDELPESDLDPAALEAALAELDAELRRSRFRPRSSAE